MEVEVGAGRDGTRRRPPAAPAPDEDDGGGGGGAMEDKVVPLEMYDSARAKIEANLRWLFAKSFGVDHIPADLRDPFYTDQYEQEHIKPPIIRLLLAGELYFRVCGLILHAEQTASLQSHQSVLQVLSRKGIHVLEADNSPISSLDLSSVPIKMSSHMHLIDALMMVVTAGMISIDKVVTSVQRFANFSASKEMPFDLEDAMVFWVNKVNTKLREISEKHHKMKQHLLDSPSHQKSPSKWYWKLVPVRYRRDHLSGRSLQHFPQLDDLQKDVNDGAALLAVVHFYCPELIRLEDICLKEVPSIADSVYNIQLLREFSNEYLNKCFYLQPEDMLYSPPVLRNNMLVFVAELFWWFEIVKPDFVQPRDLQEIRDVRLLLQTKGSRPHVPVSGVSKHSLLTCSNSADIVTRPTSQEFSSTPKASRSSSHSLFSMRQRQHKGFEEDASDVMTNILKHADVQHPGSSMVLPERRPRPLSQPVPYALHYPLDEDPDNISLARSISKDSLASNMMTPNHRRGSGVHPHRLSGQSLLSHMRIEDEEEEIEEEELVAVIHPSVLPRLGSNLEQDDLKAQSQSSSEPRRLDLSSFTPDLQADSYYLEPLMPATPKPAKEKSISLNKQEESGESRYRASLAAKKHLFQGKYVPECSRSTFLSMSDSIPNSPRPPAEGSPSTTASEQKHPQGFFLHLSGDGQSHLSTEMEHDSDSDTADFEDDEDEELMKETVRSEKCFGETEGESFKLRQDTKVSERDDKESCSGRSSPCLSTASMASSCSASGNVKMTSFAERKLHKLGLRDGISSTSSSQKTTPDGSEFTPWQIRNDAWAKDPEAVLPKNVLVSPSVVPSELLQLHMQLEEQRRAIEFQKKKMETLSARQRLKLGKAAFLNIVKKSGGKSDTLPLPLKHSSSADLTAEMNKLKTLSCRDDSCLDSLKVQTHEEDKDTSNRMNVASQEPGSEINECSRSIDLLNEAITSIQQQMMQLTLKQNLLMKQNVSSSSECEQSYPSGAAHSTSPTSDSNRSFAVHFVDIGGGNTTPARRPPRLSSSQRNKDRKLRMDNSGVTKSNRDNADEVVIAEKSERNVQRKTTFRVHHEPDTAADKDPSQSIALSSTTGNPTPRADHEENKNISGTEAVGGDDATRIKAHLVEVDLSELKESAEDGGADGTASSADAEQKNVLGFFFKDDEKAEDEMAKRRAAFLLKQQRKAEEARLRKLQQEAETELKRDEARRKAEEERIRKEEEKARRELIKQEYLRRKQEALMEEQGLVKPRPRLKSRRSRPKSLHREPSSGLSRGSATRDSLKVSMLIKAQGSASSSREAELGSSLRGSTLSLATETDSVISGGAESQRAESVCSMESFPVLSRASSKTMERDWESSSFTSSVTSIEYNGPKLFKEPSSKSNKPIIINAIAHCCLAGKVNEAQKNVVLEELEKCESNHLIVLFRDGGCQFRAIYSYSPDTEEIIKFTGTGPRTIVRKMIDRLYKYNSDRKQFTVIPAKTVSVSVDALTIHNQLWQSKRPGSARKKLESGH
ncbi:calmodulin-regulated spectrin-associated protein 1-B-like isoform X1 [Synchiropus splendidus]|uniref:calmodulin-regulated spectrin-associated protein 1-B-like isoform X1 n=1 Tax=Synchiropus splendidus TaxID=270530 RepID=UPI00237D83EB|nr:calmodulin-regulated spectrin-associated protein 1-B-like isoform X1 [Synchiropus splendidus]